MMNNNKMLRVMLCWLLLSMSKALFAWNAVGHRLVAQIAYDNLDPRHKKLVELYTHALDSIYAPVDFVNASSWLDEIRASEIKWYDQLHYINLPFSTDGTPLPPTPKPNAVLAIRYAINVLNNAQATAFDKGLSLRILSHVVADIHQPMHAVSRVSKVYPEGDAGGTLLSLPDNPIAESLHSYWDEGGGWLHINGLRTAQGIKEGAQGLEQQWPCSKFVTEINPKKWAEESHQLAVNAAYAFSETTPMGNYSNYQRNAENITRERIALAGCRLAWLLNALD